MGDLVVVLLSWLLLKICFLSGNGDRADVPGGCGRPGNARPKSCASKGKATRLGARSVSVIRFLLD